MTAIRDLPIGRITLSSAAGCAMAKFVHLKSFETKYAPPAIVYIAMFWSLLALQVAAFVLHTVFIYPFFLSPFRHLQSPKGGLPLIGHGRDLMLHGPGYMARQWYAGTTNDDLMRVLVVGNQEMIFVRSQQAFAEILVKNSYQFEKPGFIRHIMSLVVGWGLITTEGDEHKKQRRNMLPAFSFRHIKDLYSLFWTKSCESVRAMTTQCREVDSATGYSDMEILSWFTRSSLDIIGLAATGIDFGAIQDANNPLAQSYYSLNPSPADTFVITLGGLLPESMMSLLLCLPLPRLTSLKKASNHLRRVCRELIHVKKERLVNKEAPGIDILSVALSSASFTDDNLVDQMMTFLTAGHETTAAALTWAIYLLAKFPHMQQRLRNEIREYLPSPDAESTGIESTDIDKIPYLNAVCNEVLRTHSPVTETFRVANCDTTVQGQHIPRGTLLVIPISAINTDPLVWGLDAYEFKPERWLNLEHGGTSKSNAASGGATSNYALMTFIHGPHSCIGGNFSKSEMACLLAAWVGRFSFEIKDKSLLDERNLKINPSVVAKPEGGVDMQVRVIEGW